MTDLRHKLNYVLNTFVKRTPVVTITQKNEASRVRFWTVKTFYDIVKAVVESTNPKIYF